MNLRQRQLTTLSARYAPSIDIRSTEGSEDEHDRRAILSPVREVEKEADDEDVMTVIPPNELSEGAGESAVVVRRYV